MRLDRSASWVLIYLGECYLRADTGIPQLFYYVQYSSDSSGITMIFRLPKSDRQVMNPTELVVPKSSLRC